MAVRTVVIPAAGMGTRFLPATRVTPKELLPIYDTPAIQFVIDEAISAGSNESSSSPVEPSLRLRPMRRLQVPTKL
ncbi:probable UTP--glucose-1-phosphate uridylyltransferase YngB [Acidimicrobiaceae bacterium]|nr:probable UTP--glucose-1-phosphate uridylyltransferase YngB [Acidimicrobiaceae bacterium]